MVIVAFAVLTWFAFLADGLATYVSLKSHGYYGSYQTEMFGLYGNTLEPKELADFDIPGKLADINTEVDAKGLIKNEPAFAKYGISDMYEYEYWRASNEEFWNEIETGTEKHEEVMEDLGIMERVLSEQSDTQTLEEWFASPELRWGNLHALENRYANHDYHRTYFVESQERPVVARAGAKILERGNNSLIPYHLPDVFSLSAAVTAVFAVVAVIILITPPLITDRSRKIQLLQYSSAVGRKILRIQFLAAIVSAFAMSLLLMVLFLAPLVLSAAEYLETSIFHGNVTWVWLYDITFGTFALILAGMIVLLCVGAACVAFILARFSNNIVTLMVKTVPAGAALATVAALTVNMALADWNYVFNSVFHGRVDMPEVMLCGTVLVLGVLAAVLVLKREKCVDVV